uniref:Keratinocyte-associated protein 3 isoform X2 n=1 Tax=Geotrypetes seraphini TaxID=260995 RepID=A0A6P8R3G9_GEOSA|nr:keratinocyte-associated protein 3 isoform X2 [Geotrypetes seraphini]
MARVCGFDVVKGPQRLMRTGITLIFIGHINFILGAIVHGTVLRHVANPEKRVSMEYCAANIISVTSGLLHWALFCVSLLNSLLSAACFVGLVLAITLTVSNGGKQLIAGCNSSALPGDARSAIMSNDCPFDTTRIYDTTLALWIPSMIMAAFEASLSIRCFVVAFILRGIGPCGETYFRERLQEESSDKVDVGGHKLETNQLLAKAMQANAQDV